MMREAGFTLVEVMVATFIMAILSVMGVAMLSNTLDARRTIEAVVEDVEELELARAIIRQDLAQIVNRRARDPFGTRAVSAFEGGTDLSDGRLMSFVRTGHEWPGVSGVRSRLQFVTYRYEDGSLVRESRAFVDAAPDPVTHSRVLLENLEKLDVRFRVRNTWSDVYEVVTASNTGPVSAPAAVALYFVHPRFGEIETVLLTVSGG